MNRDDTITINKIAKRGQALLRKHGVDAQIIDLMMDIEGTHEVNPLNLQVFLTFDDGNFAHDFTGIYRHFNRQTKQLEDCFTPRSSVEYHRAA